MAEVTEADCLAAEALAQAIPHSLPWDWVEINRAFAAHREAAEKTERQAVVDWLAEQEKFHEATYQDARKADDDAAMDRCAARARSYGRAHDCIERGDHRKG